MRDKNRAYQQRYAAARQAEGRRRISLWVREDEIEDMRLVAKQPHALAKLRRQIIEDLRPKIERQVRDELARKTRRAMLAQKRAQARRQQAGSNRPPEMIRFTQRPPAALRNRLKAAGWLYDPVAALWHLPDDPGLWDASEALLRDLEGYGVQKLVEPL